eukprot:1366611-Alexandrium_andersonii.AAC.1
MMKGQSTCTTEAGDAHAPPRLVLHMTAVHMAGDKAGGVTQTHMTAVHMAGDKAGGWRHDC